MRICISQGTQCFKGDLNEKEIQTRGDVCIHISDSLCCTEEFKVLSNYIPIFV